MHFCFLNQHGEKSPSQSRDLSPIMWVAFNFQPEKRSTDEPTRNKKVVFIVMELKNLMLNLNNFAKDINLRKNCVLSLPMPIWEHCISLVNFCKQSWASHFDRSKIPKIIPYVTKHCRQFTNGVGRNFSSYSSKQLDKHKAVRTDYGVPSTRQAVKVAFIQSMQNRKYFKARWAFLPQMLIDLILSDFQYANKVN